MGLTGAPYANANGAPLVSRSVGRRAFKPLLRKAGLDPAFRLYDLRHSAATAMLSSGVEVRAVADRLGHTSAKMTLDVYAHTLPHSEDRATVALEDFVS